MRYCSEANDAAQDEPFPLLLEPQHHPMQLSEASQVAVEGRCDSAPFQLAAAEALKEAIQVWCRGIRYRQRVTDTATTRQGYGALILKLFDVRD
jgi:hypothetical protein